MFERTVVPRDFDLIEVPYRERGEPELISWKDCARAIASGEPARQVARADVASAAVATSSRRPDPVQRGRC